MPAVTINMHGRFPFVLLRAADRSGMHKLLVRGKSGNTHAQLLQVRAAQTFDVEVPKPWEVRAVCSFTSSMVAVGMAT